MDIRIAEKSLFLLYSRIKSDELLREASALTYRSFLAIVPLLAVLFGIAKGFCLDVMLEQWLRAELTDHQEILSYFLQFSQTTLQQTSSGIIAGTGIALLLWTAIRLLSSVEGVLTKMWGQDTGRPFLRKISDYLSLLLTCPILLAISGSSTLFITAQLTSLTGSSFCLNSSARPIVTLLIALVPLVTTTILFSLILFSMPCAPIKLRTAFVAGSIAAISFQFIQSWYILFQLRLTKISAIYESFVALPLFLVWLWISWFLLLVAGEIAVFIQEKGWHYSVYSYKASPLELFETDAILLHLITQRFNLEQPVTIAQLQLFFPIPIRAIVASVGRLQQRKLLHETTPWEQLIPCRKAEKILLSDLLLPEVGDSSIPDMSEKIVVENLLTKWRENLKN